MEFLKTSEVTALFRISRKTLWRWIRREMIIPHRFNDRCYRFLRSDVERLVKEARGER